MKKSSGKIRGWILFRNLPFLRVSEEPDINLLLNQARVLGINLTIVNPSDVQLRVTPLNYSIYLKNVEVPIPSFAICRLGVGTDSYALSIIKFLENNGTYCINTSSSIQNCISKLDQTNCLQKSNILFPDTYFLSNKYLGNACDTRINFPLILKPVCGTQGVGVEVLNDYQELASITNNRIAPSILLQKYINESSGKAIRILCIGKEVVFGYLKFSNNSFIASTSNNATAIEINIDKNLRHIGEKTTRSFGLDFCGIDVLPSNEGYLVCDVNSSPTFSVAEVLLGFKVSKKIFQLILTKTGIVNPK